MTAAPSDIRVVEQLAVALASGGLPDRARQIGADLHRRLTQPVRIGVFGPRGVGKSAVVDLITGAALLPQGVNLPTSELVYGAEEGLSLVHADGHREMRGGLDVTGLPLDRILFLQVHAPLPVLERISLLEVVADDDPGERAAALAWAAGRVDMAVWCSHAFDAAEAAVWAGAPESLRDHAFLVLTGPDAAPGPEVRGTFARVHHLRADPAREGDTLRRAVLAHVDRGRREDMDGALLFLERHGLRPRRATAETAGEAGAAATAALVAPGSSAIDILRAAAEGIGPGDAPDQILTRCVETVEEIDATLRNAGAPIDPALEATLGEAADLLVLLQLEGDEAATEDAVTLLLQVRRAAEQVAA